MRNPQVAVVNTMKPQSAPYPIVIAALALLSACDHRQVATPQAAQDPPVQVRITHLSAAPITRSVILPAQVIAFQEATLYAKVSGYLKSVAVDKGDKVAAGCHLSPVERTVLVCSQAEHGAELEVAPAAYYCLPRAECEE